MSVSPETLVSYVPALIARRFALDPTPLTTPAAEHFPATVLFADISGYTTLAAQLAQHGPSGAEELIRLLNAYFGQLIEVVSAHGGDIIKFAGDAALVLWPAIDESLATTTHRAVQCGLDMHAILGQYQVAEGLRLALKVGIGAGEVLTASVGGMFGRWELLVAGAPLTQMGAAQRQAAPGQVVLSPEAWALVQDRCQGSPLPPKQEDQQGGVLIESVLESLLPRRLAAASPAPGAEVALRGYIPGAILSRLDAGQTEWLSELRRVTVLFLNVVGLDFFAPDVLECVQAVMHALQTALYRYEGSVNQFIVDDKGTTLVAAFGLPPLTHEDDAVRGAQAALEMHTRLSELGLRCAIGVTTAQAYCGERGNASRREYAMVGNVVNMAARLMQAASKRQESDIAILCDEVTYHAAQTRLVFDVLSPIMVKGRTEPMPVYCPCGLMSKGDILRLPVHAAALIGRATEQSMLTERLQSLLFGNPGGVVVIEGDAGIGKSRLVNDVFQRARALNVFCLTGAGDAVEKSTPYHAWRGVFSQVFGFGTITDPEARRARVLEQLQSSPGLLRLAPLLNAILPLDLPENEATRQMEGQVRADNTRTLLVRLLQQVVSRSPTLLVLEDAHWMDSSSWILALTASQQVRPWLVMIATRPLTTLLPEEYRQLLLMTAGIQWLRLQALSPQDTLDLVCQCLGVNSLPDPVVELICEKGQGNPYFSEELAYALRDAGLILVADGECRIASYVSDLGSLGLPDTLQGIVTSRIDRLTPAQQLTLKVASVVGRSFTLRILQQIYPIDADRSNLPHHLSILEQLDLTPLAATDPEPIYSFKNIVIQEAAYNLMLFAQRRQLHRDIAEWHERVYAHDLSPFYSLLAHHWGKAIENPYAEPFVTSRAIDYLEMAGEQALRNYANQEAVRFLSEALDLDDRWRAARDLTATAAQPPSPATSPTSDLRRAHWERQLGEAGLNLGYLADSREHLEKAVALLGRPVPAARWGLGASLVRQVVRQAIHRLRLSRFARLFLPKLPGGAQSRAPDQEMEGLQEPEANLLEATRAYWALGQVYFYANEAMLNIYANLCSLNLSEAAGLYPEMARSYASVCIAVGLVPLHLLARSYSRWARLTAQRVNHIPSQVWVLLITSVYDAGVGNWTRAREAVREAVEISNRRGDRRRWEQSLNTLATVACLQGEFAGIAPLFSDLYESARRRGDAQYQVYGLLGQALCLVLLGKVDQAASLLEKVQDLLGGKVGRVEEIYAYGLFALTYLRQGQSQAARQAADWATRLIAQSRPISYTLVHAYTSVAKVYLALWEANLAVQSVDDAHLVERRQLAELAGQACQALHNFARVFPIGQPAAWICQGLYEWLTDQPSRARQAWRRGLAAAERVDMPYEQGWAHYELGRHAAGAAPVELQKHLAQASEIFTRLGAALDLARVEAERKEYLP